MCNKFSLTFLLVTILVLFSFLWAAGKKSRTNRNPVIIDDVVIMDTNNVELPLNNDGSNGENAQGYYPAGSGLSFLFQGGLATTGYINGQLRASWMAKSALIQEWQPGTWGMNPNVPPARFYVVTANDGPGSPAYIEWADAVALGAQFIDVNGDGVYDPTVDHPALVGDKMAWTVYNDGTLMSVRTNSGLGTPPIELEIQQTVWAYHQGGDLDDVIFFHIRLINPTQWEATDLIYSIWEDPDLGDFQDDLVGCDTLLNVGYIYNDGNDPQYGTTPPAFGVNILQGGVVDSPGDMAIVYRGPGRGVDTLLNKKILRLTSFSTQINGDFTLGDPYDVYQARNYQIGGFDLGGNPIDPTLWGIGGTPQTNPRYFYSGDPVNHTGWRDNTPADKRFLVNSGPFTLAFGDTQDIVFAYVIARGTDALNSITEMRQRASSAELFFHNLLVGIEEPLSQPPQQPVQFQLYQNYPNPFNPVTNVEFGMPNAEWVTLKVYDLMGREVKTLVNGRLPAGYHTVQWDGTDNAGQPVSSGVYLYRLSVGQASLSNVQTRKMVLIR